MTAAAIPSEPLAERVKRLRVSRHMSRIDLARAAGVTKSHVHQIETGQRTRMRLATLAKYADALGVPESYIDYGDTAKRADAKRGPTDLTTALRQMTRLEDHQIQEIIGLIEALETEHVRRAPARRHSARIKETQRA